MTGQRAKAPTAPKHRAETVKDLLNRAVIANQRIAAGLQAMNDPLVFEAFCIANRAVARAIRQRLILIPHQVGRFISFSLRWKLNGSRFGIKPGLIALWSASLGTGSGSSQQTEGWIPRAMALAVSRSSNQTGFHLRC